MLSVAAALTLAAMVIMTIAAVSPRTTKGTSPDELLRTASGPLPAVAEHQHEGQKISEKMPDARVFDSYKEDMDTFLRFINIDSAKVDDDTDLDESCGVFMAPCVASVGACLMQKMTKVNDGEVTIQASACNCFAQGHVSHLSAPGHGDIDASCDYTCLHSISGALSEYLAHTKSQELPCENIFHHLAQTWFNPVRMQKWTDSLQSNL